MRRELKLVQDKYLTDQILDYLHSYTSIRRHHPSRFVNSTYFDDLWLNNALDNLAGVSERKKVRLRWYEQKNTIDNYTSIINLEIKRKKGLLSYKEIFKVNNAIPNNNVTYKLLTKYLTDALDNNRIITPLLRPTLQVQYFREYYVINSNIRITIDNNIKFFDALSENKPRNFNCKSFDQSILEIKFNPEDQLYVASLLNNLKSSPIRNSKYLRGLSLFGYIKYY